MQEAAAMDENEIAKEGECTVTCIRIEGAAIISHLERAL